MDKYLRRAMDRIEEVTAGISDEELQRHPAGKWCPAEILEHLARAYSSTAVVLERHLASGEPARRKATWKQRAVVALIIEFGYFPPGRPAPEFTVPAGAPPEQALPHFRETLQAMDAALTRCEQQFGNRIKVASHAIFGPLTVRQWRRFHWIHTRHHAAQIVQRRAG
jgi:hypothetical protein